MPPPEGGFPFLARKKSSRSRGTVADEAAKRHKKQGKQVVEHINTVKDPKAGGGILHNAYDFGNKQIEGGGTGGEERRAPLVAFYGEEYIVCRQLFPTEEKQEIGKEGEQKDQSGGEETGDGIAQEKKTEGGEQIVIISHKGEGNLYHHVDKNKGYQIEEHSAEAISCKSREDSPQGQKRKGERQKTSEIIEGECEKGISRLQKGKKRG